MTFSSIEPFIPSGSDFEKSKQLFLALGFSINWEADGYIGFQRDRCQFILQKYDDKKFAENLMMRVAVSDLDAFWQELIQNKIKEKFGVRFTAPTQLPYGREINLIDIAGVCWHFANE